MARLEPAINSGGLLALYRALWGPYYAAVLNVLGSTGTIMPLGDPPHGQPNATTFITKGDQQVTVTWSEAPSAFDNKLDLTDPASFQGIIPIVDFNGIDEKADTPDAAYWTRALLPFSVGLWVKIDVLATFSFLGKWTATTGAEAREWELNRGGAGFQFIVYDETADALLGRYYSVAPVAGRWYHVVAVYDGTAASSGLKVYQDGVRVDDTANDAGVFTTMRDTTGIVNISKRVGTGGTSDQLLDGKIAGGPLGPFFTQKELTADEIKTLYDLGRAALGL